MAVTMPKLTEKQFMGQVMQLAKLLGWKVYHTHDSRRSVAGFPDLLLLRERMLAVELKVGKNRTTDEQELWLLAFQAVGVKAMVWYPDQWTEIQAELSGREADNNTTRRKGMSCDS